VHVDNDNQNQDYGYDNENLNANNEDGQDDQEDVDQYFDDGGETFLPADHVRSTVSNSNVIFLGLDGPPPKRSDQVIDRGTRACRPTTARERGGSS
jgi:hypothetical protein